MNNKKRLKQLWASINFVRSIPIIISYYFFSDKSAINDDIDRFIKERDNDIHKSWPLWKSINYLLACYPEFRNVYYYRLQKNHLILSKLLHIFYRPIKDLYISTAKIGSGLVIFHGFSTIIYAKSIGKNCTIYQQVTIGKTNDVPTIGDNVTIAAGAIAIGGIEIGNDSIIGAGAVVTKDVPENSVVVGNPSYIIKRNGIRTYEKL